MYIINKVKQLFSNKRQENRKFQFLELSFLQKVQKRNLICLTNKDIWIQ